MAGSDVKPVEIFYSYAHEDEQYREELVKHLVALQRQGIVSGWHDREIRAGREWAQEIDEHLNRASVILLLVSSDFLASDYIFDVELKRALARHDANEARVIPIILRHAIGKVRPSRVYRRCPKMLFLSLNGPTKTTPFTTWDRPSRKW